MDACTQPQPLDLRHLAGRDQSTPTMVGRTGEDLAADHLVHDHGMTVVARNWRVSVDELRGELDVVAADERSGILVICEVKTRRSADRFGGAIAAISHRKQAQLRRLSAVFLREAALFYPRVRLDVVGVDLGSRPRLTHLEGAW